MICFRHKVRKDKYANESRLMGIFDSKPALPSYVIVYNDPPINPGNDKILKEYNTLSLLPNAEGKSNPEKELTEFLKVAAQENFNISDAIGVMEKQLCLAIEKSSQILQAAKGLNLSDKMDMLYKNERAGKKLSNEEIYILSQKNLTQTYDMLQEKIKCKMQSKKQQLLEEAQISNDTNQEEVKLDYQPSHLDVIQESKLLQIQESADIEMEHEDNSNHENLEAQKDKTLLKPISASD